MLGNAGREALDRLIAADVTLLVLGAVAVAVPGPIRWLAFVGGLTAFGVLVYELYARLPRLASFPNERVRILFVTLRNLTIALWAVYPLVWVLAPSGVGLLTRDMTMLVIAYLDLISRAVFVILAVDGMDALGTVDADAGADATLATDGGSASEPTD
jgi:sensory rhodopsin